MLLEEADSFSGTEMLEEGSVMSLSTLCGLVLSKFKFTEPMANGNIQETVEKTGLESGREAWTEE